MSETLADNTKQVVDNVAGYGTSDKAEGSVRAGVGQGQQAVGEATGNEQLKREGTTNEVVGKGQQVLGEAKEGLANFAEDVKEGTANLLDKAKNALHEHNNPPETTR